MKRFLAGCLIFFIALITFTLITFVIMKGGFGTDEVAVVNITGEIYQSGPTIDLLHTYENRPRVKAIVLRIDSPGGSVAATQEIYEEVSKIRKKGEKPVIASLGSIAASGGYYIACGAGQIVANPGTLTGSIGVIISIMNMEELMKKIGIDVITITSGEHKNIGSATKKLTPKEKKLLQELIDNIHQQFLRVVIERRGLSPKQTALIADSRVVTGEQALEYQLIDKIGNLDDAIKIAAQASGIEGEPKIVTQRKRLSVLELILGSTKLKFHLR